MVIPEGYYEQYVVFYGRFSERFYDKVSATERGEELYKEGWRDYTIVEFIGKVVY